MGVKTNQLVARTGADFSSRPSHQDAYRRMRYTEVVRNQLVMLPQHGQGGDLMLSFRE
jgi:hypothetical protein